MTSIDEGPRNKTEDDEDFYDSGSSLYNSSKTIPQPNDENDDEQQPLLSKKKLPFPKSVFFIFLNEFCERYSFYGLEAILSLFLRNILRYTENASTVIYHLFVTVSFVTPVVGSIFADSILGKYRTTVYFSIVHSIGSLLLAVAALTMLSIPVANALAIVALLITAVGIGGIKPSVAAFGGDQFVLPEQEAQLTVFFAIYYVSINLGATLSEFFTPIIRKDVHCFGEDTCYSLAFFVPAVLMVFSLITFVMGKRMYKIKGVTESVMVNTIRCVAYAIGNRNIELDTKKVETTSESHWLDQARDKYDQSFINDIKALGKIIILFAPLCLFWTLWSQQGTTWTFQATRMTGYLTDTISIKPDQVQITNSLLILFLVPFFEVAVYPILNKCHLITRPLQRITVGCFLIALSFVAAGVVELFLEKSYPIIPTSSETSYNFINTLPCDFNVTLQPVFVENQPASIGIKQIPTTFAIVDAYENHIFNKLPALDYNVTITNVPEGIKCIIDGKNVVSIPPTEILPQPGQVQSLVISYSLNGTSGELGISTTFESVTKSNEGNPKLRIFGIGIPYSRYVLRLKPQANAQELDYSFSSVDMETLPREVDAGKYTATITYFDKAANETKEILLSSRVELLTGGSYLMVICKDFTNPNHDLVMKTFVITKPNNIHMLWLMPQYFILTIGEILFAVTGYQFAYEQAPYTMKSLIQAIWLFANGVGNFLDVIFIGFDLFPDQVIMFFFFAGLMFVDTILFAYLAYRFVPMTLEKEILEGEQKPILRRMSRRKSLAETVATNIK